MDIVGEIVVVTANVRATLVPQELVAVTEIVPLNKPAVAFIELVVEVPVQPEGSVQL